MSGASRYKLNFVEDAVEHFDVIAQKHHRFIEKKIEEQLSYTPEIKTRNRKPLEQPAPYGATWELRFGPQNCFRVFYTVNSFEQEVTILAVGVKEGNRLFIGGEEFKP